MVHNFINSPLYLSLSLLLKEVHFVLYSRVINSCLLKLISVLFSNLSIAEEFNLVPSDKFWKSYHINRFNLL